RNPPLRPRVSPGAAQYAIARRKTRVNAPLAIAPYDSCDSRSPLAPAAAAVHVDRVRGHVVAGIRAHEQHQFTDFLRLAEPLHWYGLQKTLHQLGRGLRRRLEWRLDRSRRDRQAADAAVGELATDPERH